MLTVKASSNVLCCAVRVWAAQRACLPAEGGSFCGTSSTVASFCCKSLVLPEALARVYLHICDSESIVVRAR